MYVVRLTGKNSPRGTDCLLRPPVVELAQRQVVERGRPSREEASGALAATNSARVVIPVQGTLTIVHRAETSLGLALGNAEVARHGAHSLLQISHNLADVGAPRGLGIET